MKNKSFSLFSPTGLLLVLGALVLSSCGIPFDETIDGGTIEIPNTGSVYVEQAIAIPAEVSSQNITFDDVSVIYTVRKQEGVLDLGSTRIVLYASDDTSVDNAVGDAEEIFDVSLTAEEQTQSGQKASVQIRNALNNKQSHFVMGAENLDASFGGTVYVDVEVRVRGTVSLF